MSRCVRSFVFFFFHLTFVFVFSLLPDGLRAQQANVSDHLPPASSSLSNSTVDSAVPNDGFAQKWQQKGRQLAFGGTTTSSPSSRASSPSPVRLMNIPTLKEASDPYPNRRPRRNVTLLPILALLDLSSMETNRGQQMDGDSRFDGTSLLKTAQIAVAHVNARQLIPGFHLQLLVNDSKVSLSLSSLYYIWHSAAYTDYRASVCHQ